MRIFIFHGSAGKVNDHWRPWLQDRLAEQGYEVIMQQFPIGSEETPSNWFKKIEQHREKLPDSILIGHSLGVPFILDILQDWSPRVAGCFLVGGFQGQLFAAGSSLDAFSVRDFDWEKLNRLCPVFKVYNSDNDPYVPLEKGRELAQLLGVECTLVSGAGHFMASDGYTEFQRLLDDVFQVAK